MEGDNMADPKQLTILKKEGVGAWNRWREQDPKVEPDLSGANFAEKTWSRAQLAGANLSRADLSCANLSRAWLPDANLSRADLPGANLSDAYLPNANLSEANLSGANLRGAVLSDANLSGANLSEANLSHVTLAAAKLFGADLSGVDLFGARLPNANLSEANLSGIDLRACELIQCTLTGATLTGARLYGTARDDWIITGVKCTHVFWNANGKIRSPRDRDLLPGEFERLYRALPTIEYVFQNGITPLDPLIMDRVVQAIREQNPEYDIKIDSISARGLAPSVKFTVQLEEHKEPALQMVIAGYDNRLHRIEAEKDTLYELLGRAIDRTGTRLIEAGPGAIVAMDNASISIEQHIHHAVELQKIIAEQPENSETFRQVTKRKAMDVIGGAIQDFAKKKVKDAAVEIVNLCKELGPGILNTAAYAFFKSMMPGG